jgi:hypothetical protein
MGATFLSRKRGHRGRPGAGERVLAAGDAVNEVGELDEAPGRPAATVTLPFYDARVCRGPRASRTCRLVRLPGLW